MNPKFLIVMLTVFVLVIPDSEAWWGRRRRYRQPPPPSCRTVYMCDVSICQSNPSSTACTNSCAPRKQCDGKREMSDDNKPEDDDYGPGEDEDDPVDRVKHT